MKKAQEVALEVLVVFTALRIELIYAGIETRLKNSGMRTSSCNGIFLEVGAYQERTCLKANVRDSEYILDGGLIIKDESPVAEAKMLEKKGRLVLEQLNDVYATTLWGCELVNIGKQCGFCQAKPYEGPNYSIGELLEEIQENRVRMLTLNAGTILSPDKGYGRMSRYVSAFRMAGVEQLNLELMPPANPEEVFRKASDEGVTSVQLNLEVWSKRLREYTMPYKGDISRTAYLDSIETAAMVFGPGKVSSVLMAGLDTTDSLTEGSREVLERGGVPSIEVYRPLPGTRLERWKFLPELDRIIGLDDYVKRQVSSRYSMETLEGCLRCLGCNVGGSGGGLG